MAQLHQFLLKSVFDADLVKIGAAMSQMLYYMFICFWLLLSITLTFEAESRFEGFFIIFDKFPQSDFFNYSHMYLAGVGIGKGARIATNESPGRSVNYL